MPGFMQVHAFRCARRTFDSLDKFSSKHMAYNMKKVTLSSSSSSSLSSQFDKVYGPSWHCIVGSSFGSFVTHSTGCFLYFSIEKLYILVFKTKVQKSAD
ncbi:Dynein light chain, cytoplasmic [Linum perenne]